MTTAKLCIYRARLQDTQQKAAAGMLMSYVDTVETVYC